MMEQRRLSTDRYRLPRVKPVERLPYLREVAAGKRVFHVGFADSGYRSDHRSAGIWVHDHLARSARELVGLDIDPSEISWARQAGFVAYAVDLTNREQLQNLGLEPADTVVAGELIEHLERPGDLLDALHDLVAPSGEVVLSTPNAYSLYHLLAVAGGFELINADHVAVHTPSTLRLLAERHGWTVKAMLPYIDPFHYPMAVLAPRQRIVTEVAHAASLLQRGLARTVSPWISSGLIARLVAA